MSKIKQDSQGRGPIAQKVLAEIERMQGRKVVDLSQFREGKLDAENLEKSMHTGKRMADRDPVYDVYVYAHNKISIFAEQLAELREVAKLTGAIADAQDEYMPSYPPMSPITNSYFTCWGFYDLTSGPKRETFGTVTIDLCRALGVNASLLTVFELLQKSRMGFYVHEEVSGKCVCLREFVTGREVKARPASGCLGETGQIWYARVLPDPFPELETGYPVVFATPYIILERTGGDIIRNALEKDWMDFFERNLPKVNMKDRVSAYEFFMKYGLSRQQMKYARPCMHYWNEYIVEGYVGHTNNMILLSGLPDIALSRPHSQESQDLEEDYV
jgi:hypothetical protein